MTPSELATVTPHLLATGAAGLAWWALRHDLALRDTEAAKQLHDAHRLHVLHAAQHDQRLVAALDLFAERGLHPLLLKGWSIARAYPQRGLRPYGDIDLAFTPEELPTARALVATGAGTGTLPGPRHDIDLHHDFLTADATPVAVLSGRGRTLELEGHLVRALGPEDELRLACLHFLIHGGWRATALCDIGLLLEKAPPVGFDWELCLGGDPTRRNWTQTALALARTVLGAGVRGAPLLHQDSSPPSWVRRHVFTGFGVPATAQLQNEPRSLWSERCPWAVLAGLRRRWPPDPLTASVHHRAPISNRRPRRLQLIDASRRLRKPPG